MNQKKQADWAQKIRAQYVEKEQTEWDRLKELDRRVKRPATLFAGIFGSVSALIMGSGMSLIMTDIGDILGLSNAMPIGLAIGVLGLGMALLTYPLYQKILGARRRQYADEILSLSDRMINE